MQSEDRGDNDPKEEEVIFVLRLRARNTGWWGQVKRLDNNTLRYVSGQPELYALLNGEWQRALSVHPAEEEGAGSVE